VFPSGRIKTCTPWLFGNYIKLDSVSFLVFLCSVCSRRSVNGQWEVWGCPIRLTPNKTLSETAAGLVTLSGYQCSSLDHGHEACTAGITYTHTHPHSSMHSSLGLAGVAELQCLNCFWASKKARYHCYEFHLSPTWVPEDITDGEP